MKRSVGKLKNEEITPSAAVALAFGLTFINMLAITVGDRLPHVGTWQQLLLITFIYAIAVGAANFFWALFVLIKVK